MCIVTFCLKCIKTTCFKTWRQTKHRPQHFKKLVTYIPAFQKFITRTFAPCQKEISLNSTAATFPLGGRVIRKTPPHSFLWFEWSSPHTKGKALLNVILSAQWACDRFLTAMDPNDLDKAELYQIQASRESFQESLHMD